MLDAKEPSQLSLQGVLEPAELTQIPWLKFETFDPSLIKGPLSLSVQFRGSPNDWQSAAAEGWVTAPQVVVNDIPFDNVRLEFDQSQRALRLRLPQGRLADGTIWGDGAIEYQPEGQQYLI